ncbi:DUF5518 domain-containing protein [Halogranum amylolyticum]|nr:DUF5518 domain-containing protein [Halogranum amylolyticum]
METATSRDVASRGENFYLHALLGAVVSVATSVIPFSPLLGGAVAGYLHNEGTDRGIQVGLVSGIIASLPLAAVFFLMFTIMSFGSLTTGEFAGPMFVVIMIGVILLVAAVYILGLSAIGGYIGAIYAESRAQARATEEFADTTHASARDDETIGTADDRTAK